MCALCVFLLRAGDRVPPPPPKDIRGVQTDDTHRGLRSPCGCLFVSPCLIDKGCHLCVFERVCACVCKQTESKGTKLLRGKIIRLFSS